MLVQVLRLLTATTRTRLTNDLFESLVGHGMARERACERARERASPGMARERSAEGPRETRLVLWLAAVRPLTGTAEPDDACEERWVGLGMRGEE